MKKFIKILVVVLAGLAQQRCTSPQKSSESDLCVLVDITDTLALYPTADAITGPLGLTRDIYQGVHVRIAPINDKDINAPIDISLPAQGKWSGNRVLRTSQVQHFKAQLQQALDRLKVGKPINHSIIYRTVAKHANSLSRSHARQKILLLYSDLHENSTVSLYSAKASADIDVNPKALQQTFEKSQALITLAGVQVWLMYSPKGYDDNNRYMTIANFYRHLLESKSATVHIDNQFLLP